jgi:hypothetical protein
MYLVGTSGNESWRESRSMTHENNRDFTQDVDDFTRGLALVFSVFG